VRDFLWRYWYAENRSRLVLALIALAILVVLLLVRRLRVFHVLVPAVIGGIVVLGWFLYNPLASTPLLPSPEGPVVENGVAAIVVCGNKRDGMLGSAIEDIAPEPRTGGWSLESRGGCDIHYHHPPNAEQRKNRHERAEEEQGNLSPNLSSSREMQQRCIFAVVPPRPCATIKQPVL
jgi:hypothetical protein